MALGKADAKGPQRPSNLIPSCYRLENGRLGSFSKLSPMRLKHGEARKHKAQENHRRQEGSHIPQTHVDDPSKTRNHHTLDSKNRNLRIPDVGPLDTIHFKELILQTGKLRLQEDNDLPKVTQQ